MNFKLITPVKKLTDGELMLKIRKGQEKAFEELYRRYARRLQGLFYRMLGGDTELAADFTQEIFERIWKFRDKYTVGEQVSAWIFTMAYNVCRNEYRHREVADKYLWQMADEEEAGDSNIEKYTLMNKLSIARWQRCLKTCPRNPVCFLPCATKRN